MDQEVGQGGDAARDGEVELQPAVLVELEEGTPARDDEGVPQPAVAESHLIVAVEDADRQFVVRGQWQHPEGLDPLLTVERLLAEEPGQHVRAVHLRQIVLVHGVERAGARAHHAEARGRAERQGEQRQGGLQVDRDGAVRRLDPGRLLAGGDPDYRACIWVPRPKKPASTSRGKMRKAVRWSRGRDDAPRYGTRSTRNSRLLRSPRCRPATRGVPSHGRGGVAAMNPRAIVAVMAVLMVLAFGSAAFAQTDCKTSCRPRPGARTIRPAPPTGSRRP